MKTKLFVEIKRTYLGNNPDFFSIAIVEIVKSKMRECDVFGTIYPALSLDKDGQHIGAVIEMDESETVILKTLMFLKKSICVVPIFVPLEKGSVNVRAFKVSAASGKLNLKTWAELWENTENQISKEVSCYLYLNKNKVHFGGYSWGHKDTSVWSLHVHEICQRLNLCSPVFKGIFLERFD